MDDRDDASRHVGGGRKSVVDQDTLLDAIKISQLTSVRQQTRRLAYSQSAIKYDLRIYDKVSFSVWITIVRGLT